MLASVVWLALLGAVAYGLFRISGNRPVAPLLTSPGLWFPLVILVTSVAIVLFVRRAYGRCDFALEGARLIARPSALARLVRGAPEQALDFDEVVDVRLLSTRYGNDLVLFGSDEDTPPLRFPLAHGATPTLLAALAPRETARWSPAAAEARDALLGEPGFGALSDPRVTGARETAPVLRAAGLWQLASQALWPGVLAHPTDRERALALHHVERCRLATVTRLSLMQALLAHHGDEGSMLLDYARLCLSVRNRVEARAVLDRLVELEVPPAAGVFWRSSLRERKQVPAPPSKATMGIEVNLPTHHLQGDTLVVDGRWEAGLEWFIGYRLLSGFWGPPRRIQLIDLWGQTHFLIGDPLDWAARLERAAPHLAELHDEGFLPLGTGARIRRLRRLA